MPPAERDGVRQILEAIKKVSNLGDSRDAEAYRLIQAEVANLKTAQNMLQAQLREQPPHAGSILRKRKVRFDDGGNEGADEGDSGEDKRGQSRIKKSSLHPLISKAAEQAFYAKWGAGDKKRCFFSVLGTLPSYEAWGLLCRAQKGKGKKKKTCSFRHPGTLNLCY
jgi:hypothetical protein